jgi:hypothetical protein
MAATARNPAVPDDDPPYRVALSVGIRRIGSRVLDFFNVRPGATNHEDGELTMITFTMPASVSGIAQEGQLLTAVGEVDDPTATITYQWQARAFQTKMMSFYSFLSGAI